MRWHPSLRARATLLGTVAFAVLLAIGSIALVTTLESRLTDASDQLSRSRVDDLLALARTGDLPSTLRNVDDNGVAQVVGADGTVLAASENIAGKPAVADLRAGQQPRTSTFRAADDSETESYRFWYAAGPSPDGTVTVYVGDSLEAVSEASAALRHALWLGVPVVVVVLGFVIWFLLGRTIGRLDRIRAEVDRISEENLHTRVAGDGVDDEVGRLAATMNALLERLDAAAQRQRDFVADVSHDLQSPLAAQRVALELALRATRRPRCGPAQDRGAGGDGRHGADGRGAPGAGLDRRRPDTSAGAHRPRQPGARGGGSGQDASPGAGRHQAVSAAPAYANAGDVRRVVRNLLENAVTHAESTVSLTVDDADGWATLDVVDDGPGVPVEHRDRIFDRFYRAEDARSRDGGNGLGLSIARGLTERNGGRLELVGADDGATMRLRLPTRGHDPAAP